MSVFDDAASHGERPYPSQHDAGNHLIPLQSDDSDNSPGSDSYHDIAEPIIRSILENTQSANDISPSGELLRAIERFHRARGIENTPAGHLPAMSSEPHPDRRRRIHREQAEGSPLFVLPLQPSGEQTPRYQPRLYASSARRGRPRMAPSDRYLDRHRALVESGNGLADLQNAGRQLEQASSSVRALLDDPVPHLSSPALLDMDYSGEAENNRRSKRRRLDTDTTDSEFKGFSYGRYGQVEPGRLKMEIVSCDGGILDYQGGNYGAENVLRNDATVYCTKNNRCNLVLRHQGATVFSLQELIIKAPQAGYSAPVQEGMVFISMISDDLLSRTAQYQIQYSPPRDRCASSPRLSELPPIFSVRHNNDGTMSTAQARARRLYDIGLQDEECDHRTAQIPPEFTTNAPPFNVTIECSDSEEEEGPSRESRRRSLLHMMGLPLHEESDSSDEESTQVASTWPEEYIRGTVHTPRLRRRETYSNIALVQAEEASQIATQEAIRAVGGELMAPHARFHIERGRSKCTVRFDPPVSGRFILLKMWSPRPTLGGNIDIQSVVAKGFAGPRYFPAISMR